MKRASNNLIHRFNNQFSVLVTAIDAMSANLENKEYLKEVLEEIQSKKNEFQITLDEIKRLIEEKQDAN
ncbi:MAG: hypothetical protein JNM93_09200 [Bacteriovoracaceae bacterium]|nr:hypothetical protein [Bacteriovoracaceae bacterium]